VRGFDEAVPPEVADYYGPEDVEILKEMLADPDQARNYDTIAALIGHISDANESDAHALIDFVKAGRGSAQANLAAAIGLGFLAGKNGTGAASALQFLAQETKGKSQRRAGFAVSGLAVSGRTEARAHLELLRGRGGNAAEIDSAINENHRVSELGLRRYYAR
jgi:hypothetical protein